MNMFSVKDVPTIIRTIKATGDYSGTWQGVRNTVPMTFYSVGTNGHKRIAFTFWLEGAKWEGIADTVKDATEKIMAAVRSPGNKGLTMSHEDPPAFAAEMMEGAEMKKTKEKKVKTPKAAKPKAEAKPKAAKPKAEAKPKAAKPKAEAKSQPKEKKERKGNLFGFSRCRAITWMAKRRGWTQEDVSKVFGAHRISVKDSLIRWVFRQVELAKDAKEWSKHFSHPAEFSPEQVAQLEAERKA
jgi:hypothetical protein